VCSNTRDTFVATKPERERSERRQLTPLTAGGGELVCVSRGCYDEILANVILHSRILHNIMDESMGIFIFRREAAIFSGNGHYETTET
jgi:hypothetical protein